MTENDVRRIVREEMMHKIDVSIDPRRVIDSDALRKIMKASADRRRQLGA